MSSEIAERQQVTTEAAPWRTMALSEAIDINPKRLLPKGGSVPFLDMASLPLHGAPVAVTEQRPVASGGARFKAGDTLFARITPCAENGKLGFVSDVVGGQTAQGSTEFIVMGARDGITLPEYVRWLSGWRRVRDHAIGLMEGTSGRQRIPAWAFGEIDVPVPPLDEQRRIAEVLRSVDEAIATTQRTVQAAADVRQVTLDAMVQRVLDEPKTEVRPLSNVAEVRTGLAKNKNRAGPKVPLPYLRVANVQDGWFDLADMQDIEVDPGQVDRYLLQAGDVLLTEGGDYDKLGRGGVWHGQITPCLHQNHVFCVRPDTSALLPDYFALTTQSAWGRAYFLTCAKRTTNLASINSSQLRAFPVPVVPTSTQAALIEEVAAIDDMIDLEERQLETLLRLRAEVSSDLLSGRVRVPA